MSNFFSDLRFAVRQLRRDPGFALVAILTLGVGIGATTVIFSVFNGTVLRELPYPESEQLVRVSEVSPRGHVLSLSEPTFLDLQERSRSFSRLVAVSYRPMAIVGDGDSIRVSGAATTEGLFEMLGAVPALGRAFSLADFQAGDDEPTVIIGYGLWESLFGAEPNVVGRTVNLDGKIRTIVGVMPQGFEFPNYTRCWIPFTADPNAKRTEHVVEGFGRLAPGVALGLADADVAGITAQLEDEFPQTNRGWGATLLTFREWQIGPRATHITIVLLCAVSLLLLLACASVSNLLLARATGRHRELALRASLGALRPRILGQLFAESLVLAFLSACFGLFFTAWVLPVIQALETDALPRLSEVNIDQTVLLFTVLVTVITGLFCGAAPAFQASNHSFEQTLRGGERIVTGGSRRVREALVICQLALAVVLLVGAGLLTNSFVRMLENSPENEAERVAALTEVQVADGSVPAPPVATLHSTSAPARLSGARLNAVLVGLFAAAALGLAALGLYGVTAFSVARRKREIGVRMALGAGPRRIIGVAISSGTRLILFGTAIGLFGAFGLSRFLSSMLFEIRPSDPFTYVAVTLLLAVVATVANYLPALRATKINPRVAFESE